HKRKPLHSSREEAVEIHLLVFCKSAAGKNCRINTRSHRSLRCPKRGRTHATTHSSCIGAAWAHNKPLPCACINAGDAHHAHGDRGLVAERFIQLVGKEPRASRGGLR